MQDNIQQGHGTADYGGISLVGSEETFYCLSIIGQIEGHYILDNTQKTTKYDHLLPLLVALEESDRIDGVLFILNTLGGDVEAGLAISELIASMTKPTASIVLGGGHSIGVPLAVSAKRSFIVPSATMTIHPVRTSGTILGVPQSFDYLEKMQNRIIDFKRTRLKCIIGPFCIGFTAGVIVPIIHRKSNIHSLNSHRYFFRSRFLELGI